MNSFAHIFEMKSDNNDNNFAKNSSKLRSLWNCFGKPELAFTMNFGFDFSTDNKSMDNLFGLLESTFPDIEI